MSDKYAALRAAAEAVKETGHIANYRKGYVARLDFAEAAKCDVILDLLAEREADKARIAELTGRPAEEYQDDSELCFVIDECDDLSDYQTAQWLKELRRRRAAGITPETGE